MANRLSTARRVAVVKALVEGNSIRSTVRLTGVAKHTIQKLILDLGAACAAYMDANLKNLPCKHVQCDEIWSFIGPKDKNVTPELREKNPDAGSVWTWTALCADTKLIISCLVGGRDAGYAHAFMQDVASRLRYRVQLTVDGHKPYLSAVEDAVATDIDYVQLVKVYGAPTDDERRYSPAQCIGAIPTTVMGGPDPAHISTSDVERQNFTMRMSMRRFTRLTNAFSRKIDNHIAMTALYFQFYDFGRVHQTLRVTPAMEAGVSDHVWTVEKIVGLLG